MQFDYKTFHIDCRARHDEDGHYVARARITVPAVGAGRVTAHDSGDIDSFVSEADAISCAKAWAIEWCDENWD
ncbi:hypothetical protein [Paraburkholderia gardini]|uniref:Uncharacterized protein n=1 Tax=Paraburkholderia gardini TaxID=2823469 RepID=A0ABM8UAJ9_9BURK|nr:hypothetical protein [Paraburkholderia gardini]CAG4918070.1 hypothetical protein R69919_04580 [Paraburkholderia gardini]CAG4923351.1 hypothetical protein R54767_04987 [Paraburkholderia gardini]